MLRIIEDETEIRRYARQFLKHLRPYVSQRWSMTLGYPGGSFKARLNWSESLGIWFCSKSGTAEVFWQAFGAGKPKGPSVAITCEINLPKKGKDRRVSGALAQDSEGRVYVVHRGKLGGKKGAGKTVFEKQYRGAWTLMDEGDTWSTVVVVASLQSPNCARHVAQFVQKVERIKLTAARRTMQTEMPLEALDFHMEQIGDSFAEIGGDLATVCDHGLVVADLAAFLKHSGLRCVNYEDQDLAAINRFGNTIAVFQVVKSLSNSGILEGVARLILARSDPADSMQLILVTPAGFKGSVTEKLERLGIRQIKYLWHEDGAAFTGLENILQIK